MDFDAMDFLTGLFRGDAVPSGIGRDLGPQMTDNASALEETAGGPTAPAGAPEPAPTPSGAPDADAAPFPGWILRPDVTGRLGWEPPDLPEERRWWARARFEDLPTLAAYFRGSARRPEDGPCPWCGRREWWRSIHGVVVCGHCHPPAVPGLVVEWLDAPGEDVLDETAGKGDNVRAAYNVH